MIEGSRVLVPVVCLFPLFRWGCGVLCMCFMTHSRVNTCVFSICSVGDVVSFLCVCLRLSEHEYSIEWRGRELEHARAQERGGGGGVIIYDRSRGGVMF